MMFRALRQPARFFKPSVSMVNFKYQKFCGAAAAVKTVEETEVVHEFTKKNTLSDALKPREVVAQLDNFIIGQAEAKRAVAIALRNRWRRHQLGPDLKNEVIPKNILMIGPTGCGKTEIARRIAKLSQAPFIKVEATKFTEVGFHGKDVDQIIKDLVENAIILTRSRIKEEVRKKIAQSVEDRILEGLIGHNGDQGQISSFADLLRAGEMEDRMIDVDAPVRGGDKGGATGWVTASGNIGAKEAADAIFSSLAGANKIGGTGGGSKKTERKKLPVREARTIIEETEIERLMEDYDITAMAIEAVEENGIVFIDEIDKLVNSGDYRGADASSEGVQRDLLPLIEGSTISTKHGNVNTDFILFIASGAFHSSKPSDLLAELQGRLPIRVTLKGLTEDDLYRILTEPVTNLLRQQKEMLLTEQVNLEFTDGAVRELARVANQANRTIENIGARRLHTVIERVIEEISFDASDKEPGETITVTDEYVRERVSDMLMASDLRKYIL